ncbi:truncated transcription factor CAULIFLOWER A-like [Punica granatum]|uniref:Uncharacterized protein n=2 Tax=Punica granatum TaxID=22663 RepID=A0A218WTP5_PUNGR|nr:truncated transcription factor CAULIFLOWER A-like [Punica granatum]OWM76224.1 hypothetical protein CDL15_Pgr009870 [Punica granatum]PKI76984.1 hypothetical protein CRG98_002487 [Punica granatum]
MGRRKLEMKRIEDRSNRQVTFSKRRNGLIKKARELSVLCDVDVALLVFSSTGKLYEFCSSGSSLANILERYRKHLEEADASDAITNPRNCSLGDAWQRSHMELLQLAQSHMGGMDIEQLNMVDLVQLEKQLDAAMTQTRFRKIQLMEQSATPFYKQELRQENRLLEEQVNSLASGSGRGSVSGQHQPHQLATLRWMNKP